MEINNKKWADFDFSGKYGVFICERGKRLTTLNQSDGDIAYISSTKRNNGVDNYISPPDYMTIYENAMTISNSGSVGYCFYHPYNFVCSDHCTVVKIKDDSILLNNYIALFLKPIIESMRNKYNFAREISDARLSRERIKLPTNERNEPDWQFMEKYIKELSTRIVFNKKTPKKFSNKTILSKLDISNWKTFELVKIFPEPKRGMRLIEIDRQKGEMPFYSASDFNNGLTDKISNPLFTEKNALIYMIFGKCYYVEGEFTASDEIAIFKHEKLNLYTGLFLSTIINQNKYKYSFGRKAFYNKYSKDFIKLPAKNNEPDWEFMENYIKSLPYSASM